MKKLIYTSLTLCMMIGGPSAAIAADSPAQMSAPAPETGVGTCEGTIIDEEGQPLIGASVLVEGTKMAVASDIDGRFSIRDVKVGSTILISFVGYKTVAAVWSGKPLKIEMMPQATALDDVVVVAYGTQKKSSITGSISQVTAESIETRPVSSVTSALEGTTSGITVSGNYGQAGDSPTILIRGIGTINGTTSPLYVIDGVPYGGNISDLNPNDIESMSVLKDAASTALYGNRASNGVILITTKKAKNKDKVSVNLKMNQGWYQRGIPEYERMGIADWMDAQYQILFNNTALSQKVDRSDATAMASLHEAIPSAVFASTWLSLNPFNMSGYNSVDDLYKVDNPLSAAATFSRSASLLGTYSEDLDWWDQATRTGYRGEYIISAMGATNKSDYMFSVGYLDENGYMKDNDFKRITGRANVNINPISWFKTGLNVNASHQKIHGTMNGVGDGNTSFNNAFYFCRYMSPIYPVHQHYVYEENLPSGAQLGDYVTTPTGALIYNNGYDYFNGSQIRNQNTNRNIVWEQELNTRQNIRNTLNSTFYTDFILPMGFTVKIQGNLNTRNTDYYNYQSAVIGDAYALNGALAKTLYTYKQWTFQQQLLWNYTFKDVHHFNVILGHENYSYHYDYTYAKKTNQAVEGLTALCNFSTMTDIDGYRNTYRTESYLARVQYNYNDRYNVEASFRRDGSSRFSKNSRWGNFGSVGANWVFSNEEFLKDEKWLNNGKIFANWGQVGNDASAGYYSYMMLMGFTQNQNQMANYLTQYPSDDLKWETSESWGIGVDAWMFDRWHLSVEYYDKRNKDLIFNVVLPTSAGPDDSGSTAPTIARNIGTITNRGVEISTDIDIFKNKDWTINFAANMSMNQNRVVKLSDQYKYSKGYDKNGNELYNNGYYSGIYRIEEGHSRYDVNYYHWAGVDMMDGYSLYTPDLEKYYIEEEDGTIIGGIYTKDASGNLVLDTNSCSKLNANITRCINGQYYVTNTTYAARIWRGDALPKVNGSFKADIKYRDFSVSALFTYSLGGKIYDSPYASLMSAGSGPAALAADATNSWTCMPEGMTETSPDRIRTDINPVLNYSTTNPNGTSTAVSYQSAASDRWLVSRDFLCFKNLNVAYNIPKKIMHKVGLSSLQLSFSAENLFIKSARKGMNPMMGISATQGNYLVPARVYTFGLSLNF